MFDLKILRRAGRWKWQVGEIGGKILIGGWGASRPVARYQAYRALFLLLQATSPGRLVERI
jgi:hypothetical protein